MPNAEALSAPAAGEPLVVLDNVEKTYYGREGPFLAVASASLDVRCGEFVSLLGPSGCGKSTVLLMIAGLENSTKGQIVLGGAPVTGPRRDIGMVFQDATLLP